MQSVQVEEPSVAEYVPAAHVVQVAVAADVAPAGPYSPAEHQAPRQKVAPGLSTLADDLLSTVVHVATNPDLV